MRIVVTGSNGQLGRGLQTTFELDDLMLVDLPNHDITDIAAIVPAIRTFQPDLVIHCAAMTDVDGCEREPELAYRVNVLGTRNLAVAAQAVDCPLVYISTDYVFDGEAGAPYLEYDEPHPLSVYGRTKLLGECMVRDILLAFYVVRVAWLYGDGPRNFVRTVLRLAEGQGALHMVTDEVGAPTYARDVAQALAQLITMPAYGMYHLPNSGVCSRFDWAREILTLAGRDDVEIIPTQNYQRAARVPKRVEMRNLCGKALGIVMRPWQEALKDFVATEVGVDA